MGVWLTVVGLLPRSLKGVRISLSLAQKSRVERPPVVRRGGVLDAVLVDPSDPRPPLDGDVGRLEAKVLDHYRFRSLFAGPGDGRERQATPPTSPSVPSLKNSLRVIAMRFPPSFFHRRTA